MTTITVRTKIDRCYAGEADTYFTVVAETKSGRRFASMPYGEAPGMFPTLERAQRFATKVTAKGSIDPQHWVELDPIYGSAAWLAQATEAASYKIGLSEGWLKMDDVPEALQAYL